MIHLRILYRYIQVYIYGHANLLECGTILQGMQLTTK